MTSICVIEDQEKVSSFIKKGLTEHNYMVQVADNGRDALEMIGREDYSLVILDVMLPDMSGIEICRRLREQQPHLPVLMLSALGTIEDKVNGLQSGADDYLVKPFHFNELIARIEALLRRKKLADGDSHILSFGGLKLNTWDKTAEREGRQINLTAKEYSLLVLFINNPGKLLSREFIMERVWGINFDTGTNMVDVYVNYLRNKIEKGFNKKLIHTVIGMGYILKD
jgi:two-component system copper resistance phosphate regulon response regulator CusR